MKKDNTIGDEVRIFTRGDNGHGDGTWLDAEIYFSRAWLSLGRKGSTPKTSYCSAQILILFLSKRQFRYNKKTKKYGRIDDNKFTLTHAETESYGIPQGARVRAIDELLAKGFIKIVRQGGAYEKDKTDYGLVDDFWSWHPGHTIRKRKPDIKRGFQGRGLGVLSNSRKGISHTPEHDTHSHARAYHTHTPEHDTLQAMKKTCRNKFYQELRAKKPLWGVLYSDTCVNMSYMHPCDLAMAS